MAAFEPAWSSMQLPKSSQKKKENHPPWIKREQSSGRYLISTFLLRYLRKPKRGDVSSYSDMAFRISDTPPLPRPSSSTSSRLAYLRRNLFKNGVNNDIHGNKMEQYARKIWFVYGERDTSDGNTVEPAGISGPRELRRPEGG